jgi:hypothetical protein
MYDDYVHMQTSIKANKRQDKDLLSIKYLSSAPVVGVHSGIKVPSPASITDPKSKVPGVIRFPGTLGTDILESSSSSAAAACASSPGTMDSKAGDAAPAAAAPPTGSAALDDDDDAAVDDVDDEGQGQMEDEDVVDAVPPVFSCSAAGKALPC